MEMFPIFARIKLPNIVAHVAAFTEVELTLPIL